MSSLVKMKLTLATLNRSGDCWLQSAISSFEQWMRDDVIISKNRTSFFSFDMINESSFIIYFIFTLFVIKLQCAICSTNCAFRLAKHWELTVREFFFSTYRVRFPPREKEVSIETTPVPHWLTVEVFKYLIEINRSLLWKKKNRKRRALRFTYELWEYSHWTNCSKQQSNNDT